MAAYRDPQDVDDWAESLSADEVDDLEGLGRATVEAYRQRHGPSG